MNSVLTRASPSNDSWPLHATCPEIPLLSTAMSKSALTGALLSACSAVMLCWFSPSQLMFATSPRMAVMSLMVRSSLVSVRMSPRPCENAPERMLSCATVGSKSPAYTLTRIRPAGASNDHWPFSSASVKPIGTQYVSGSKSSAPSPENASRSISKRTPGNGCPLSDMVTWPDISAPE